MLASLNARPRLKSQAFVLQSLTGAMRGIDDRSYNSDIPLHKMVSRHRYHGVSIIGESVLYSSTLHQNQEHNCPARTNT